MAIYNFIKNLFSRKKVPMIFQTESAECGLACLLMISSYHGLKVNIANFRDVFSTSDRGLSLNTLMSMSSSINLSTRLVQIEPDQIDLISIPSILHWNINHFVVLKEVKSDYIVVNDPSTGPLEIKREDLGKHLSGIALEITPTEDFQSEDLRKKIKLSYLWTKITGLKSTVTKTILLSVLFQIGLLSSPFLLKIGVDEIIPYGDVESVLFYTSIFALIILITSLVKFTRDRLLLSIGNKLSFQIGLNLFSHMMKLPLDYFKKRRVGDITSRFSSISHIKDTLTNGVLSLVIDGALAVVALALLIVYSPLFAAIATVAIALYSALRFLTFNKIRQYHDECMIFKAKEESSFLESLRAIQAIKIFGREDSRTSIWQNYYKETIDKNTKLQSYEYLFTSAQNLIFGIENIAMIAVGITLIVSNQISIGVLFVAITYKSIFVDRIKILIDKGIELKLLDVYMERLLDIINQKHEVSEYKKQSISVNDVEDKSDVFSFNDVSFKYPHSDKYILENVSFNVVKGESLAIIGKSGEGKTTLIKLILRLIDGNTGEMKFLGQNINDIDPASIRKNIGVVMQSDQLLSGSILDNITFFDPESDSERAIDCAKTAMVHDDISEMPMKYESYVGDMGDSLSGGQKQRVLLARALYQNKDIIIMDEGTANIDIETEAALLGNLKRLGVTIISIAHRPESLVFSDRLLSLQNGILKEENINSLNILREKLFDQEVLQRA